MMTISSQKEEVKSFVNKMTLKIRNDLMIEGLRINNKLLINQYTHGCIKNSKKVVLKMRDHLEQRVGFNCKEDQLIRLLRKRK